MRNTLAAVVTVVLALATQPVMAEVKVPSLFADNMVLQQGMNVPVWGWAKPGEKVSVKFAEQAVNTAAGKDGKWSLKLAPLKAGGKPSELVIVGENTLRFKNVVVGEVWLCSGQSNMAMILRSVNNAKKEIADAANYGDIRLYKMKYAPASDPKEDNRGVWSICTPASVTRFSAVAYFFGRDLNRQLKVPIALISASRGGSTVEAWTSKEKIDANAALRKVAHKWDRIAAAYDAEAVKRKLDKAVEKWKLAVAKAKADGKKLPYRPRIKTPPMLHYKRPEVLYNGMIHPLIPFAMRGVIWYQGESNANDGRAKDYALAFGTMIGDWRGRWAQGDFPFIYVQLANFRKQQSEPCHPNDSWAIVRDAQLKTLTLANTAMASAVDVGSATNIHPKNKQDVGGRLALAARAIAYGEKIVYSGPIYDSMSVADRKIVLKFRHVGGGLVAKGGELKGFAIAGTDGKWCWGEAKIVGETIVVSSDHVPDPKAVRYSWARNPIGNLYNKEQLPASPFRTDEPLR